MKISELIANVIIKLKYWDSLDLKFWDNHPLDYNDINSVIENLAYRNYCGWHLHELYFEEIDQQRKRQNVKIFEEWFRVSIILTIA